MFVHPSQVAEVLRRHPEARKARLVVSGQMADDKMELQLELTHPSAAPEGFVQAVASTVRDVTKLGASIRLMAAGELPNDGKVIEDARSYA
jgi:phenylacetate-CoA ligase